MKREYNCDNFCRVVDYMMERSVRVFDIFHVTLNFFRVPGIYLATDFICAFPTETEEDFNDSLSLVRKYQFPSLFINQFYSRSGTPAARLKKISTKEVDIRIFFGNF